MVHGDDRGLVIPPKVATTQVVMIPIGPPKLREPVIAKTIELYAILKQAGIKVKVDDRADVSPGWKFNEYEMRGVPLRIELGPRDMENGQLVLVSRVSGEKRMIKQENLVEEVQQILGEIQREMFDKAKQFRDENLTSVDSMDEMAQFLEKKRGFILAGWCGSAACEAQVKEETGATSRNIPFSPTVRKSHCVVCGDAALHTVVFGRSY
jgi:prolyl-tRNA synthetase